MNGLTRGLRAVGYKAHPATVPTIKGMVVPMPWFAFRLIYNKELDKIVVMR